MKIMVDSEYLDKLKKNLGFKEDGSLEAGKNLEVDGTTKMNGGFEPIHEYEFTNEDTKYALKVFFELLNVYENAYTFIGAFGPINAQEEQLVFGQYVLEEGSLSYLEAAYFSLSDTVSFIIYDGNTLDLANLVKGSDLKTIFGKQSLVGSGNIDLYRHKLNVQGENGTNASWVYYTSSSNLTCDSVQDLRTLLKVGDIPVWAPGNLATGTFAPIYLYVSSSSCVIKTSETESTPVISVSDKVTTI